MLGQRRPVGHLAGAAVVLTPDVLIDMADTTPPNVVITDNVPGTLNRASSGIAYAFAFDESITGFTADDLIVDGGTLVNVGGQGKDWQAYVIPTVGSANTQLTVTLKAGAVTDLAGNPNAEVTNSAQLMNMQAPAPPKLIQDSSMITVDLPEVTLQLVVGTYQTSASILLFPDDAPQTVANFLAYAQTGFYDGTIYHRVIKGFVFQGGGLIPGLAGKAPLYNPIALESQNGLSNVYGSVAMARAPGPNTATSQYYINLADNPSLDYSSANSPGYTVFGVVSKGMDQIDLLATVPIATYGGYTNVPQYYEYNISTRVTSPGLAQSRSGVFNVSDVLSGAQWEYSLDSGQSWLSGTGSQLVVPRGQYVPDQVQVRQTDTSGRVSFDVYSFPSELKVGAPAQNSPPAGALEIYGTLRPGQSLTPGGQVTDPDGIAGVNYQWAISGVDIEGATSPTYAVRLIDTGRQLTLKMSYEDGWGTIENVQAQATIHDDQRLTGGAENDTFTPGFGNDTIIGGDGIDTVKLPLFAAAYDVQSVGDVVTLVSSAGTQRLEGIEQLQFGKTHVATAAMAVMVNGNLKTQVNQLTDLYLAFFGRAPDVSGLEYWVQANLNGGKDLSRIAKDFSWSTEAQALFPTGSSNRDFVQLVYNNCFDRQPDAGGWDYWTGRLNALNPQDPEYLNNRGAFVGELLLGAYATSSGDEDRTLLGHRHEVALHYANLLANTTGTNYETAINQVLARVDGTTASLTGALAVIDHAMLTNVTLTGVMSDATLLSQLWGQA